MNSRRARRLAGLYPEEWRTRYREEFQLFLEDCPSNFRTILDVLGSAMHEHALSFWRSKMDRRRTCLALMLYACMIAIVAGTNFYWTVDDTPFVAAMTIHPALLTSWNLVKVGAVLFAVVTFAIGIPVLRTMTTAALATRRWDVIHRLAIPPCAGLVVLVWLVAGARIAGGHWVPTPWDIAGNLVAPADWPPLSIRWTLGFVSLVLMTAGIIVSVMSFRQAIFRSDWSSFRRIWLSISSMLLTVSLGLMVLGVLIWGWLVEQYAASDFHAHNGGFFSSTNFASWIGSLVLLLTATATAVSGTRSAFRAETE
jgi:hypothetical protein